MSPDGDAWYEAAPFGLADADGRRRVEGGLRFSCTMCGNCCSGVPGTVMVNVREIVALAARLGVREDDFLLRYTKVADGGVSLVERLTAYGWDCVFLDRTSVPGKALCGVYSDRPEQCRTWPFWKRNLVDERSWARASATCPGINRGPLHPASMVRLTRDASPI